MARILAVPTSTQQAKRTILPMQIIMVSMVGVTLESILKKGWVILRWPYSGSSVVRGNLHAAFLGEWRLATAAAYPALAENAKSFQEIKKQAKIILSDHPESIYCGCTFDNQLRIDHKSCGYEPGERRALKIEWEHLVPAS